MDLINLCYKYSVDRNNMNPSLKEKSHEECQKLIKVIVAYERIDFLEEIFNEEDPEEEYNTDLKYFYEYNYPEFISDSFAMSVISQKHFISFYLFKNYSEDIYENNIV